MNPGILAEIVGCDESVAKRWAKPIGAAAQVFGLTKAARIAAWLSAIKMASSGLSSVEENMYLSAEQLVARWPDKFALPDQEEAAEVLLSGGKRNAILYARRPQETANYVFAGTNGNGSEYSGDGWNFRPRGLLKIVGKDSYKAFGESVRRPRIVVSPHALTLPEVAAMAAGWLWNELGASAVADRAERDADALSEIGAKLGVNVQRGVFDRAMLFLK